MNNNKNGSFDSFIFKMITDYGANKLMNGLERFNHLNPEQLKSELEKIIGSSKFKADTSTGLKRTETIDGVYTYIIDIPGFTKDEIENMSNIEDDIMTIAGKKGDRIINHKIYFNGDTLLGVSLELGVLTIRMRIAVKTKPNKIKID